MGTIKEQMEKWQEKNGYKPTKKKKSKAKKKNKKPIASESLSERDLRELMGTNRATYERRRGSIRQR
ncbi:MULTISPECIES: hypothetical protein [Bacillaceae]|uniref:hypothetical protein n=1 Tax=Bacillaceae TaxID=186817 RepID=UPI0023558683|nr:hypothetical protein [Bacillus weihaiensis]